MSLQPGLIEIGELLKAEAILAIQDGNHGEKHPKASDYVDEGISFVMANDLNKGILNPLETEKIPEGLAEKLRIGFSKTGDVLLTHKGTIGNTAIVPDVLPYVMLTPQVTYYRVNPDLLDNQYLMYCFRDIRFRKVMTSLAQQSTRPYIGITAQRKLKIFYRGIEEQKELVRFIKSYDDLIANNYRRIKLLDDTARILYKEWFVHLRFPGHEHVKITDGTPAGWDIKKIGEILTLNYGKALKSDDRVDGDIPVYGSSGVVGTHSKYLVSGPGIIVGRKGNVGSIHWSTKDYWPIDTVYFISKEECNLYFYYALQYVQFINTDVAVPGLNRDMAYGRTVLIPSSSILESFLSEVEPIRAQIEKLEEINTKLLSARDLLLPRLMNGDITV
ncbi:restriction endonuclease subunit S [Pseudomonas sp. PA15(2017)]|uniref:restriction endonuclease subunit S n=1 Tax=Pseudomonas sp. PA15(2017) TaxID=1932111 RepID=UPI0009F8DCEA|nr:restriction endonuclease subunit S [Pseudomonas sp. PA15(2017)]